MPLTYVSYVGSSRFCHWHCVTSQYEFEWLSHSDAAPATMSGG